MSGAAELAALLAKAADGDRVAFRDFYDRTSAKLFAVVLRILGERGEAEDVVQEVYVTIWRKAAEFDSTRASPITWTTTIARNRAIDRLRSKKLRPAAPLDDAGMVADSAPLADALVDSARGAVAVHRVLAELEPKQAAAIRSCYFEGLTYEELAARDGVPVGTLKSWVRRGILKMRDAMEREACR